MKIRVKIIKLPDGHFVAVEGSRYQPALLRWTEREARIAYLEERGRRGQEQIDAADAALRALGAVNETDHHGYLA